MIIRHDVPDLVLIGSGGLRRLAGIVSHKTADIDLADYHPCKYGSFSYQARISHYAAWIDGVIGTTMDAS